MYDDDEYAPYKILAMLSLLLPAIIIIRKCKLFCSGP